MNPKFKLALIRQLKFALNSRSTKDGFAIPIAVGMGLLMILVGITMVARSQGDKVNAIQQQGGTNTLAVTEGGLSASLAFIKQYTPIAAYNLSDWTSSSTTYTGISCSSTVSSIVTTATALAGWSNFNSNSTQQYQLQNYTYIPDNAANGLHSIPGTGTLDIRGRTGVSSSNPEGSSKQHLKVTIRVGPPTYPTFPVPGLWIGTSAGSNTDNEANILASCGVSASNFTVGTNPPWKKITTVSMTIPTLPDYPAVDTALTSNSLVTSMQIPAPHHIPSLQSLTTATGTFPRTTIAPVDVANSDGVYEYIVTGFSSPTVTTGKKVIFYKNIGSTIPSTFPASGDVKDYNGEYNYLVSSVSSTFSLNYPDKVNMYLAGSINLGGSSTIYHNCSGSAFDCSLDFKIYGYSPTGQIAFNGNTCLYNAFIMAPTYTLSHSGGGNCGHAAQGDFIGLAWIATWVGSGGGNHTGMRQDPTVTWAKLAAAGITLNTLPPTITPTKSWQQAAY